MKNTLSVNQLVRLKNDRKPETAVARIEEILTPSATNEETVILDRPLGGTSVHRTKNVEPCSYYFPLIHLNGNSGKQLSEQYMAALDAIEDAYNAFRAIDFNARNYYPMGMEHFEEARKEVGAVSDKFAAIKEYLVEHAMHVDAQTTK